MTTLRSEADHTPTAQPLVAGGLFFCRAHLLPATAFRLPPLVAGNFKEITMLQFLVWLVSNTWHVLLMLALVAGAFVAESIFGLGDE
jgi:hypothetical protein